MKVYLLEMIMNQYPLEFEDGYFSEFVFHIPGTDLWFAGNGYAEGEILEEANFTDKFWKAVEEQQLDMLTYIGEL